MLTSCYLDVISFFVRNKCQKIQKIDELLWKQLILAEKVLDLLSDLSNFNEIFMKDVIYDITESHKKVGFYPLLFLSVSNST